MGESETVQLHSFNTFNSFINNYHNAGPNSGHNGGQGSGDGKKYKLRLKFDGACALEVVRLNGGHFQNLTHLDISGNSAEKLDLRSLTRLEWLCCSKNQLEILILSGVSLTYLDCSYNNLQSIVIDPLPNNLSTLQMSFNNLQELPSWTWMIPELFIIYASHNRLRQVDCKFQNCLSHLPIRELHLHSNKIEFVSKDFIQRATRLKLLNLSQNLLEHMPSFGRRCNIQELYMSRNRLQDTDEKEALEFLTECTTLRRLHLAFNKIEQINEKCIPVWKNLEELILCGNRLRNLPSKMSSLSNLRVLRVHSNQLETAPTLTKMPNLKVVDLSHNNLRKINLENLISGGNLTYLDISCNERLTLNPEKLHSPRRPMNLVEVTHARKPMSQLDRKNNLNRDFPVNAPWELGFSELPDRNQNLSITQYRDVNLSNGREALFGLFDGGDRNPAPKAVSKSIAKLYAEERNIEESPRFSLKYTLLNALRNLRQQGNTSPMQGILCLLSMQEDQLRHEKPSFVLNLAMVGEIRCVLVETGKKVTRLTDSNDRAEPYCPAEGEHEESERPLLPKSNSENELSNRTNNKNQSIQDPKVVSIPLSTSAEYLLIANQSVWNYVSEKELVDELEIHRNKKSVLIAKRITDMAQSHSCKQSLSILLVRFKWHSSSRGLILDMRSKKLGGNGEYGPLSYYSGSSDYSDDITNPLVSVTTPDSAIETDRSSGAGSIEDNDSRKSNGISVGRRRIKTITTEESLSDTLNDDSGSISNTSVSQMSVEQFRCWEYMLEQNTRLLFKKELDTLSKAKAPFQRNQKLRKSVHFPYTQESPAPPAPVQSSNQKTTSKVPLPSSNSVNLGFYTLSKAKSLSQLFGPEAGVKPAPAPPLPSGTKTGSMSSSFKPKSHFPLFTNANAGFLESVRATRPNTRGTILGGPNAAYFGSAQRLVPPPPHTHHSSQAQPFYEADEIQEIKGYESLVEHDTRLKKYWDNKITEL